MELYQQNILGYLKSVSGKNANRLDRQTFGGISAAHVLVDTSKSGKETGYFGKVYCTKLILCAWRCPTKVLRQIRV